MKKLLFKIIALALSLLALFTLTACGNTGAGGGGGDEPAHVHDYIDHVCSCGDVEEYTEGLKYIIGKNNTCTILGFEEGVEVPMHVIIPTKMENKPVKTISASAFENATFTKITLPEGLEMIMTGAFRNSALTVVTIPSTVKAIYGEAFFTKSITNVTFVVKDGWYWNKFISSNPSDDQKVPTSITGSSTAAATHFKDYNDRHQDGGANKTWFRVDK